MIKLADSDNGKQITAAPNEKIEIQLSSNPTTGHRWAGPAVAAKNATSNNILLLADDFIPNKPVLVGSGGFQKFIITSSAVGEFGVKFLYKRSWETNSVKTFTIKLSVR